jgi:hypothetical protein
MKYAVWLSALLLCSATLMFAQDKSQMQGQKMSGTICNSACVTQQSGLSTCDPTCTDKSGSCVFVSDKGTVMKVDNPEMAMPHMGKHVTMMASKMEPPPSEKEREQSIRIMQLYEEAP